MKPGARESERRRRLPGLPAAAFVWLAFSASAWGQTGQPYRGPGMMWNDGWFGWILGPIILLLLIVAVVMLAIGAIRWLGGSARPEGGTPPPLQPHKTALDILKERYARGEIDTEEYREKRRILDE